jgi:hypothetical protein
LVAWATIDITWVSTQGACLCPNWNFTFSLTGIIVRWDMEVVPRCNLTYECDQQGLVQSTRAYAGPRQADRQSRVVGHSPWLKMTSYFVDETVKRFTTFHFLARAIFSKNVPGHTRERRVME